MSESLHDRLFRAEEASESIDLRKFRATVRNEFLQMERVKAVKNLDPLKFLLEYDFDCYCPYLEDALMALGDDFECLSRMEARHDPRD
jgi:hypothetical protein